MRSLLCLAKVSRRSANWLGFWLEAFWPEATRKTFELVAEQGPAPTSLKPMFIALLADDVGAPDGALDAPNTD